MKPKRNDLKGISNESLNSLINQFRLMGVQIPSYINENVVLDGISYDKANKVVKYNINKDKENIDTSLTNNPAKDTITVDGVSIPVYSVFRRIDKNIDDKQGMDGNPLIYALKGDNEWRFGSDLDRNLIWKQADAIVKKYLRDHSHDVAVLIPSSSDINTQLAYIVKNYGADIDVLTNVMKKVTTQQVLNVCDDPKSYFWKFFSGSEVKNKLRLLNTYLNNMNIENKGFYSAHKVHDMDIRDAVNKTLNTLQINTEAMEQTSEAIDGKDVLIIDDLIRGGDTLVNAIHIIKTNYKPKSISILTLLSKKMEPAPEKGITIPQRKY